MNNSTITDLPICECNRPIPSAAGVCTGCSGVLRDYQHPSPITSAEDGPLPAMPEGMDWLRNFVPPPPPKHYDVAEPAKTDHQRLATAREVIEIPERHRWAFDRSTPPSTVPTPALALLWRAESLSKEKNVVLIGPAGNGKSSLASAMLRCALERHPQAPARLLFVRAPRLGYIRIQKRAGEGEHPYVERAMQTKVVVLDDLGTEKPTANDATEQVVLERHYENLPTWITTNLDQDEIKDRYDTSTYRRIFDGAAVIRL